MSENLTIDSNLTDEEKYKALVPQIESLLDENDPAISSLSNFTAALKQTFEKISWAGFYLFDGNNLYLGPFQGKIACTFIKFGSGVCGTSAKERRTVIVPDVNKFPGHIFCDVDSKSEIVLPLIKNDRLLGVLDLDSTFYSAFNELDQKYLEELCRILVRKIKPSELGFSYDSND